MALGSELAPLINRLRDKAVALPVVYPFRDEVLEAFANSDPFLVYAQIAHLHAYGKIPKVWKPALDEMWARVR
jgi:hypothetical protein